MKTIAKDKLPQLLETVSREAEVLVPRDVDGVTRFAPWAPGVELRLAGNVTVPPKELVFPQTQIMYRYGGNAFEQKIEEVAGEERVKVVFGVRACDVQGITVLDRVFLTRGFEDALYRRRREKMVLLALACDRKGPACFCTAMGIDPQAAAGADIQLYDLGEAFGLEAKTDKGQALLARVDGFLAGGRERQPVVPAGGLEVKVDGLPDKLRLMFEHPFWDHIYQKCLGCGTCTFLCPTCHCFDIQCQNRGSEGFRFRCWDSCMYPEYTQMAGGHNPRPGRKERLRQRFLHKLQYIPERYELWGCVGCGRCIIKCPVNVDITRIIAGLQEVALNA